MPGSIQLVERRTRKPIEAEVVSDLSQSTLRQTQILFQAYRERAILDLYVEEILRLPGSDWDWVRKSLTEDADSSRFFGVVYDGKIQGLMMLNMKPVRSQGANAADELLYLEYLETAPWNQPAYAGDAAQFAGVGILLLRIAVEASIEAGCQGRLALHSLVPAEGFYRPYFEDMGIDPIEGLRYFEMDVVRAEHLLRGEST